MSRPGTGKTALVDRAIEELDAEVAYLFLSARRLLAAEDPVAATTGRSASSPSR